MDAQQLTEQIKAAWSKLDWNLQSTAIAVLALVAIVGVVLVQRLEPMELEEPLFAERPLTPSELRRIEVALASSDLENYSIEGGKLRVPKGQRGRFLAAMQAADCLPQTFQTPVDAASGSSIFETARQRDDRAHRAREQKARLAICALPGIEDAFVFFDRDSSRSLRGRQRTTAVVGVKTAGTKPLALKEFQMIQDMVLHLDANLQPDGITVHDLTSGEWVKGPVESLSLTQQQALMRRSLEHEWRDKVQSALAFLPAAKINVTVQPSSGLEQAEGVSVVVSIPLSSLTPSPTADAPPAITESVEQTRHQVRSAVLPLLPVSADHETHVLVNFVDDGNPVPVLPTPWWTLVKSPAFATVLFGAVVAMGIILFVSGSWSSEPDPSPKLKVFSADDPTTLNTDNEPESVAQLRAYIEEDPEAVAQSLTDFIDRAS